MKVESMESIGCFHMSRYMGNKRQNKAENRRKPKSHEEEKQQPRPRGTHGRACGTHGRAYPHHGPCAPPRAARGGSCPPRSRRASYDAFCARFGPRFGPWIFTFWASFCSFVWFTCLNYIYLGFIHTFLLKHLAWIIQICNQHSTSQNKHSWRNRGVNHRNIH